MIGKSFNKIFIVLLLATSVMPVMLSGVPTFNGKYPSSLIVFLAAILIGFQKSRWFGRNYVIASVAFSIIAIISLVRFPSSNIEVLQTLFRLYVLATPVIFFNIYSKMSTRATVFTDITFLAPVPLIFIPYFLFLYGLNPYSVNESIVTYNFIQLKGIDNFITSIYFDLGNSTSISPALSVFFIYSMIKLTYYYRHKSISLVILYGIIGAVTFYANLWFHQRIFFALLVLVIILYFSFKLVSEKYSPLISVAIPLGITLILSTFDFDIRSELWRAAFSVIDIGHFLFGEGLGNFEKLNLIYSHPHNIIILFLFEYGIVGMLTFFFIIITYDRFIKGTSYSNDSKEKLGLRNKARLLFICSCVCWTINSNLIAYEYWVTVMFFILPIKLLRDLE